MSRESEKRRRRIKREQHDRSRDRRDVAERQHILSILATSDPDDEAIRRAHGFMWDAKDYDEPCLNGCEFTFGDIIGGKIRKCMAREHHATEAVEAFEHGLWNDDRLYVGPGM